MTDPGPAASLFDVRDRIVCITGGAGFLGRAFTRTFLEAGARVAMVDREGTQDCADEAGASPDRALALKADVTDPGAVQGFAERVLEHWGAGIDVLVNGAAIDPKFDADVAELQRHRFEDFPLELWAQTMDVNLAGTFLCCQAVGKIMRRQGRGNIVNIASTYGVVAPDQRLYQRDGEAEQVLFKPAAYPVSKAGVIHFTRYLAAYWANTGIRVNSLTPHGVYNAQDDQFVRRFAERSPMGRMARPQEIAGPLLFLASDASSYVNGANLVVDGGWTAW